MSESYQIGDQVEVFLDEKFGEKSGWYTGTIFKIDPYSEHRNFYWINFEVEAQAITGTRQISVFNLKKYQKSDQGKFMKYLFYVFYFEAAVSLISAIQSFFMPTTFLKQFALDAAPVLAVEMTRWYGVLLFVLVYLLLQGLRLRGAALKLTLQGLLLGDFLQIGATFVTARALGGWSVVLYMSVILSVIYIVLRGICLWKPTETGIDR